MGVSTTRVRKRGKPTEVVRNGVLPRRKTLFARLREEMLNKNRAEKTLERKKAWAGPKKLSKTGKMADI